jgi:hypothetical protein
MRATSPRTLTAAGPLRTLGAGLAALLVTALLAAPEAATAKATGSPSPSTSTSASPSPTTSSSPSPSSSPTTAPVLVNPTNPATPGSFTGYGFDQCNAPSQSAMDAWLASSPYLAAGIYISGNSRACKVQDNLTSTWVATQLAKGWHLLPITLGPQASCSTRFPRYGAKIDPVISAVRVNGAYVAAAAQGTTEADRTLAAAASLGLVPGSTMFYDLEAYDISKVACRDSALTFLSAWTKEIKAHGYLAGIYSSAGSGLKALDQARASGTTSYTFPDQIWIADWNGHADTSSSYLSSYGWASHARVKQYQGGHNETYGGVTINIDRDFLDVGRGSVAAPETHCANVPVDYPSYPTLAAPAAGTALDPALKPYVRTLRCLLKERAGFTGRTRPRFNNALVAAISAWSATHGQSSTNTVWNKRLWLTLLATNTHPTLKYGSVGPAVRDLQRALLVTAQTPKPAITGVFDSATQAALTAYQTKHKLRPRGIVTASTWAALSAGVR